MKRVLRFSLVLLVVSISLSLHSYDNVIPGNTALAKKLTTKKKNGKKRSHTSKPVIAFNFEDEELVDIINRIAALKEVNILLPTGGNAIKAKVTLSLEEPLDVDEAWDMLPTLLNLADYNLVLRGTAYNIVKTGKGTTKEPLPLYIGTPPEKLPDTDQHIRLLYYFSNLRVAADDKNEIIGMIKHILPEATYNVDTTTNGVLITDKARNIKSAMNILLAIDQTMYREQLDIITLRYTSADLVAKLFNENILKTEKDTFRYRLDTKQESEASYFARQVKIMAHQRTNSLIVLGKMQIVERVKDFIQKYIDVPLDSGKSVLHVYELQYLDAEKFEGVLSKIVESMNVGATGQARAGEAYGGTERFFEGVIVKAFKPSKEVEATAMGNKILIAAKNDDWNYIKQLIEELDTPMPQVIIEVLIADLTLEDARKLGNIIRNPQALPLPDGINMQAAHVNPGVIYPKTPTTLASDLMIDRGGTTDANVAANTVAGTTLLTINDKDGKTWSALQFLKLFNHQKILSHPHIVVTNNQSAKIEIGEKRLLQDDASAGTSATTIRYKEEDATLTVNIKPRISSAALEEAEVLQATVNLDVKIGVTEFAANDSRIRRDISTNANVKNGGILALGGLIRTDSLNSRQSTPILSKIPILGWFFKDQSGRTNKTNLTVFISPTIVIPRLRGGVGDYTNDYINLAKQYSKEGELFDNLRDPITRWFFKTDVAEDPYERVDKFAAQDEVLMENIALNEQETPTTKNSRYRKKRLKDLIKKDAQKLAKGSTPTSPKF